MSNISLRQLASFLHSNTVIGMARRVGLTPPPPPISVRHLVNLANPPLKDMKDDKDDQDQRQHKDDKDNKDNKDVKELQDAAYGGGGEAEARTARAALNGMDQAAEVTDASGHSARPMTLLTGRPIV